MSGSIQYNGILGGDSLPTGQFVFDRITVDWGWENQGKKSKTI
jgi:hypothetical protein